MEAMQTATGPIQRDVHITLTAEEFAPHKNAIYRKAQQRANVKGFRPGKVPLSVVQKLYGKELDAEAAEAAIQKAFGEYAEQHNLNPFGTPYVIQIHTPKDGSLSFIIRYEVLPEFELGEYKGLKTKKIFHVVTPEEIDREVEWLRERNRTEETVDTIADENHTAVVDFQKLDDSGTPVIGDVSRDVPVNLRSERINPGLKEALLGKRLDDKVHITLPVGGEDGEKDIPYELTIKDIKQVGLPELNAEFAAKLTGEEESDVEDLRDMIKQSIEAEYDSQYGRIYRDALIDQLITAHDLTVPGALVGQIINSYLEDEKRNHPNGELPKDFPYQQFFEEQRESAERVAQWLLIRDKIVEAENLTATDEDVDALARMDAERLGMEAQTLIDYYKGNEEITQRIVAEKVMQLLMDYSEVEEEIEDVEWQKQQEAKAKEAEAKAAETEAEGTGEGENALAGEADGEQEVEETAGAEADESGETEEKE